jgi:hypothetical protein
VAPVLGLPQRGAPADEREGRVTRPTSIKAYEHLVENKLLVGKQRRIIEWLTRGDYTSGETIDALAYTTPDDRSLRNVNAWRARFTELQQRGLIVEAGERECGITGRRALVWHFTGRTKPLKVTRVRRGAKAWKTLAMDLWGELRGAEKHTETDLEERIRALGGKP